MSELEALLRHAVHERESAAAPARADLLAATREAADAVKAVTNGAVALALAPLDPHPGKGEPFALVLRWRDADRVVRVIELGVEGYPVKVFGGVNGWRDRNDCRHVLHHPTDLAGFFRQLLASRTSEVVGLVGHVLGTLPEPTAVREG